jgi:hypothetical protein
LKSSESCSDIQTPSNNETTLAENDQLLRTVVNNHDLAADTHEKISETATENSECSDANLNNEVSLKPPAQRLGDDEHITVDEIKQVSAQRETIVPGSVNKANHEIQRIEKSLDLFDFVDGVYQFNYAPDDIPGLACFKWVRIFYLFLFSCLY